MNMFKMHDFLIEKNKPCAQAEIPVNQIIDFGKSLDNNVQDVPTSPVTKQGKPFPWDLIKITGCLLLLGYALHKIFPKHDNCPSHFDRRRLAQKKSPKLD